MMRCHVSTLVCSFSVILATSCLAVAPNEQVPGMTPLHVAAQGGDTAKVEELVRGGADLNSRDCVGRTPLLLACEAERLPVVRALVAARAEINGCGVDGTTALHAAARSKDPAFVRELAIAGTEVQRRDWQGRLPVHVAAESGSTDTLIATVCLGDIAGRDFKGRTALHILVLKGDFDAVRRVLPYKPPLDVQDLDGATPLHLAARGGYSNIVELLLEKGARPALLTNRGFLPFDEAVTSNSTQAALALLHASRKEVCETSPLDGVGRVYRAIVAGMPAVADALIAGGATVQRGGGLDSPLVAAAARGELGRIRELLGRGVPIDEMGTFGGAGRGTALHSASLAGQTDVAAALLEAGADVNAVDGDGRAPLHWARSEAMVKLLVGAHAEIERRDARGETPLACRFGSSPQTMASREAVAALLRAGASPNTTTASGVPLLSAASYRGDLALVKALLDAKADPLAQDVHGLTALHCAASVEAVRLLAAAGGLVNKADASGRTPLHYAGSVGVIRELVALGGDVNAADSCGRTPLYYACSAAVAIALLSGGAKVDCQDKQGLTPVAAAQNGIAAAEVIPVLAAYGGRRHQ